jgi:hypothetical protein
MYYDGYILLLLLLILFLITSSQKEYFTPAPVTIFQEEGYGFVNNGYGMDNYIYPLSTKIKLKTL